MKTSTVLIRTTAFSALLFFAASFLSFSFQLYPVYDYSQHGTGFWSQTLSFPLQYYSQFMTDSTLHFEWDISNLCADIVIFWTSTLAFIVLRNKFMLSSK
ncbi:MAG: hypothetical protein CVU11_08865 [Bacteroidetes bacterium HGW-Bacteroidetes-6]|nr:MAG: hypothetical protein CVU11_08865 [Bacteroidetes bacterium HGW-Bacteroidetes-6]